MNSDFKFSLMGDEIAAGSGIKTLMDDLGQAFAEGGDEILMLGGGNPAHIPAMEEVWKKRMLEISQSPDTLRRMLGIYDSPQGNTQFIRTLASMLEKEYSWPIGPENVAITNGGQTAFFCLFNLLAGNSSQGQARKILLPIIPEYIGYANQGLDASLFHGYRPQLEETAPHRFKYHVDFNRLEIDESIAAICVSRPTNPTGNVLENSEMAHLSQLAKEHGIPFIIDNAYGQPFPSIVFKDVQPLWAEHHLFVMSLSKLGLPGTRTAAIIAPPEIIQMVTSMTAIMGLANGNLGQTITHPLIESREILRLSRDIIQPYYRKKRDFALQVVEHAFPKHSNYALHETDGALFLWLWLKDCPVTSLEFYERLKKRNVLVVPGDYFFFGLSEEDKNWRHRHECLRISFSMNDDVVERGLKIIGEEIEAVYRSCPK